MICHFIVCEQHFNTMSNSIIKRIVICHSIVCEQHFNTIFIHLKWVYRQRDPETCGKGKQANFRWSTKHHYGQKTILPDIRTELTSCRRHPFSRVIDTFTNFPTRHILHYSRLFLKILLPLFDKSKESDVKKRKMVKLAQ